MNDAIKILVPNLILVVLWFLDRQKTRQKYEADLLNRKEETKGIVVEQFEKLNTAQANEIDRLEGQVRDNLVKIKEHELANEDCEYKHEVAQLQLKQVMQQIDWNNVPKASVFVLDDNRMVIMDFRNRFKNVPTIDCRFFFIAEDFLNAAKEEKPEVVILDYVLGEDLNAEDVIAELGYQPEVFIMSQDKSIQLRIREKGMQFFYKDEHYVMKIARSVIQHLQDKN